MQSKVKIITYSAICITLAFILSQLKFFQMPQGGDVTFCSMLFIALTGYWFGSLWGAVAGAAYGLLSLVLGGYVIHPIQLVLDYPLAYAAVGFFAGIFRTKKFGLQIGYTLGGLGRLLCAFTSGVVFFPEYAPVGESVFVYSFVYNLSYILPEMVITLIIISIPTMKKIIDKQKSY